MTAPLSVLHLLRPRPLGEVGGADLHLVDLAQAQAVRGLRVTIVALGNSDYAARLRRHGLTVLQPMSDGPRDWWLTARRAVAEFGVELVHSHGYRADLLAAALRSAYAWSTLRPAFVMSAHGFIRTGVLMRALTVANERVLASADLVIASSRAESVRLRDAGHRSTVYIGNGVMPPEPDPRDYATKQLGLGDRARVAFIGRLSREKRPDLFLTMAALLNRRKDVEFIVLGSGPELRALGARSRQLRLTDRVRFTGLRDDIPRLLGGIDVLVCPSDTEGTPRAIVEAMLAGVPIVATAVGGVPDLIVDGESGVLVAPGSATQLAAAVGRLLDQPNLARDLAAAAATRASANFTVDRMERLVAAAYSEALAAVRSVR